MVSPIHTELYTKYQIDEYCLVEVQNTVFIFYLPKSKIIEAF